MRSRELWQAEARKEAHRVSPQKGSMPGACFNCRGDRERKGAQQGPSKQQQRRREPLLVRTRVQRHVHTTQRFVCTHRDFWPLDLELLAGGVGRECGSTRAGAEVLELVHTGKAGRVAVPKHNRDSGRGVVRHSQAVGQGLGGSVATRAILHAHQHDSIGGKTRRRARRFHHDCLIPIPVVPRAGEGQHRASDLQQGAGPSEWEGGRARRAQRAEHTRKRVGAPPSLQRRWPCTRACGGTPPRRSREPGAHSYTYTG